MIWIGKEEETNLPEQSMTPSQRQCGGIQYVLLNIYAPQLIWPASHSGGAETQKKRDRANRTKRIKCNSLSGKIISAHEMRLKSSLNELKETD